MTSNAYDAATGARGADAVTCPNFHAAVELIGRKWNGVILQQLLGGPLRFRELRDRIPRITDAMLSLRLKELESAEIVQRIVDVTRRPVEVRYALTGIGDKLAPVLEAVAAWGADWAAETSPPLEAPHLAWHLTEGTRPPTEIGAGLEVGAGLVAGFERAVRLGRAGSPAVAQEAVVLPVQPGHLWGRAPMGKLGGLAAEA